MVSASSSILHEDDKENIHQIPLDDVFKSVDSSPSGLSSQESDKRIQRDGPNVLTEKKETPIILKFLYQFNNFFSYLLLLGATLSFISEWLVPHQGSIYIAWALIFVTMLNAVFTFMQEYKAEKVMKSFKKLMSAQVVLLRDGKKQQVDSSRVVVGDIMLLSEGDKITADGRIISLSNLKVDHSSLTGESEPQLRDLKSTSKSALLSRNMVFSGTWVQSGLGKAVVVSTGDRTQVGRIAKTTREVETPVSHLQMQIGHFIKVISYIAIVLGLSFFILGILVTKNTFGANMVFAIGIIVANVPEGLLPTVTLTLSISAQGMAKHQVLVKNIDAIETLGSVTVICSDKTGTLTLNDLNVHGVFINGHFYRFLRTKGKMRSKDRDVGQEEIPGLEDFNSIMALCNNSTYDPSTDRKFGDPTEICLKKYAMAFTSLENLEGLHKRMHEIPFSSETKYMITSSGGKTRQRAYLKGAPKIVLSKCNRIFKDGKSVEITDAHRREILSQSERFAKRGFRILGGAMKDVTSPNDENELEEEDYCFYGLVIMQDPPRKEVPQAVEECRQAGIRIVVISGDHEKTVESISRQVGIIRTPHPRVLTGENMSGLQDDELKTVLENEEVLCARALPRDKLRIVNALRESGSIVAVTGDGVNDAPALQRADVGVAMGLSGTEVAKEAADIVLLDDNFASIVKAIKSGRTVYDNIKRFITYILTSNTPEIVPFLLFVLLGWPLALPVLLILAIDLGTDMLPAIGLGIESSDDDVMTRKPRDPNSKLLNWKMIARSYGFIGPLQTAFAYIVFFEILFAGGWTWGQELGTLDPLYMSAIAGFFSTVVIIQIFNVFTCRTTRESIFKKGLLSNRLVLLGIASEIILLALLLYLPLMQKVFGVRPFDGTLVLLMLTFGAVILVAEEIRKYLLRNYGIFGLE